MQSPHHADNSSASSNDQRMRARHDPIRQESTTSGPVEERDQLWCDIDDAPKYREVDQSTKSRPAQLRLILGSQSGSDQLDEEGRPTIFVGDNHLRDEGKLTIDALVDSQQDDPYIFVRGRQLVAINQDHKRQASIVPLGVDELRGILTKVANFYKEYKTRQGESQLRKVPPPNVTIQYVLSELDIASLPFLPLEGITQAPVVRPDGSILDRPGYDSATGLYYSPGTGLEACTIEADPTPEAREDALKLVWEAIGEFCYTSESDRANALALLLTPLLRPAIAGHVPLALIDAHKAGSGKTMLAQVVSMIACGQPGGTLAQARSDEEWDKRITAKLMSGTPIILIDNVAERLESGSLEAVLTSSLYEGRILGRSEMVQVPNLATWIATGNHLKVSPDLSRRCYRISLDAGTSQPWRRKGFTHPDLMGWVMSHRVDLLQALLTIVRAWYAAGQPAAPDTPTLGTFSDWARILSGTLAHAGVSGFLRDLDKLYEIVDDQSAEWTAFLTAWREKFGVQPIRIAELIDEINTYGSELGEALPAWLKLQMQERLNGFAIRLGLIFEKHLGIPYGPKDLRLAKGTKQNGYIRWFVDEPTLESSVVVEESVVVGKTTTTTHEAASEATLEVVSGGSGGSSACFQKASQQLQNGVEKQEIGGKVNTPAAQIPRQEKMPQEAGDERLHLAQSMPCTKNDQEEEGSNTNFQRGFQPPLPPLTSCEVALQANLVPVVVEKETSTIPPTPTTETTWEVVEYLDQLGRSIDIALDFDGPGLHPYFEVGADRFLTDVEKVYAVYRNESGEEVINPVEDL